MKVVSDTNIFLAVILGEPEKDKIIEITSGFDVLQKEEVEIRRKDGSIFSLRSKPKGSKSPFSVAGVKTKATTKNIIDAVRNSRAG